MNKNQLKEIEFKDYNYASVNCWDYYIGSFKKAGSMICILVSQDEQLIKSRDSLQSRKLLLLPKQRENLCDQRLEESKKRECLIRSI